MSDLRELYQEVIIDHGRRPRNFGELAGAHYHQEGFNPLCGDKLVVHVQEKNGMIENIMFQGSGCAISMASASLMTEILKGKTLEDAKIIFSLFHELVIHGHVEDEQREKIGKLAVLGGVSEFPARVKCATLAWHSLNAILEHEQGIVCTEG